MHTKISAIREKLLDHVSPWMTGGLLLALTGAAPEDWVSRCAHVVGASNSYSYLRSIGVDLRVVPVTIGVAIIVVHRLAYRRRQAAVFASDHVATSIVSSGALPGINKEVSTQPKTTHARPAKAVVELDIWAGRDPKETQPFTKFLMKECFDCGFLNCSWSPLDGQFSVIRHWGVPQSFADEIKLLTDRALVTFGVACNTKLVEARDTTDGRPAITIVIGEDEIAALRGALHKRPQPQAPRN